MAINSRKDANTILAHSQHMCPSCDATDIIKYGKSRSGKQVFKCKPCGTKFTEGGAMPRRRIPPNVVGDAIVGFYDGLSYRDIQRQIETRYGFKPSTATPYEWVRDYVKRGRQFLSGVKANTGDLWVADEMMVRIDGHQMWLWNVMDAKTRFLLATHLSKRRTTRDAVQLFRKAKARAAKPPKRIRTNRLAAYIDGIEQVFGGDTRHVRTMGVRSPLHNNLSERLQGTLRERTKVMRGMETPNTAAIVMDGFMLHYNHMKPHHGLGGKTPAEVAGLEFRFRNWVEVAHLHDATFKSRAGRGLFTRSMFRRRRGL